MRHVKSQYFQYLFPFWNLLICSHLALVHIASTASLHKAGYSTIAPRFVTIPSSHTPFLYHPNRVRIPPLALPPPPPLLRISNYRWSLATHALCQSSARNLVKHMPLCFQCRRVFLNYVMFPHNTSLYHPRSRGSSASIVTMPRAERPAFQSRQGQGFFLFATAVFIPALGPTQSHIQWVPGALRVGVKRPGREANHTIPYSLGIKSANELYLHAPKCLKMWCLVKHRIIFSFFTFSLSSPRPERLWGPPSLLSSGYQGLFPWG
jgi:hypothetical protein